MNFSQPKTPVEIITAQGWIKRSLQRTSEGPVCAVGACYLADGNCQTVSEACDGIHSPENRPYTETARLLFKRRAKLGKIPKNYSGHIEDWNDRPATTKEQVVSFLMRVTRLVRWQARAEARKLLTATDVTVDAGNTPALSADLSPVDFLSTVKPTATTTERNAKLSQ